MWGFQVNPKPGGNPPAPHSPAHVTGEIIIVLTYFCVALWYAYPFWGHAGACCLYLTLAFCHGLKLS
jgi:hypothetical protein